MNDQSIRNRKRIQELESRVSYIDRQIKELKNILDAVVEKVKRL